MKTILYLCRHAEYENPKQIMHGRLPGFHLSDQGKKSAVKLAKALSARKIVAFYSSPLERALETAEIVARGHGLQVLTDNRLIDIKTPLQGQSLTEVAKIKGNFYQEQFIKQGGERLVDLYNRCNDFIHEKLKQHTGEEFAIVTHGDLVMSTRSYVLEGTLPKFYSYEGDYVRQGWGYRLKYESDKFQCIAPIE